jgi:hypothetical protein
MGGGKLKGGPKKIKIVLTKSFFFPKRQLLTNTAMPSSFAL